ncbi:LytR/AlgR family response regulator transcription factor [Clostridium rectalis]|uniref:LytR/AlgR family response regulator transcription factor n=1 Tax=Clostridium rectalis TaxID=2040295 RepID=UPI000F632E8F|nr:LytTR family DNA-binding domain-containing protein [Clostridium rectalis]
MNNISCVIIEDEIPATEELKYILTQYEFIKIVGIAYDGESGLNLIKKTNPNAVFLDINIPLKNGLELSKDIKIFNNDIDIIFVTAYENHALKAFELAALDYILKPFDDERINNTINRLYEKHKELDIPNVIDEIITKLDNKQSNNINKIPCEYHGKIILVPIEDIYFCYTENEKVYVKTKFKKYLTTYTMNKLQNKYNFFRSHRSYVVNLDNIKELFSWFNGTYKLVMNDDENSEVPISRNNVKKLKNLLGL